MLIVENLSKSFNKNITLTPWMGTRNVNVIDDISFSINQGDRLAILGHNGSGKTTLLKSLFGSIQPDSGNIIWKTENKKLEGQLKKISSLLNNNDRSFFWRLTVRENLKYFNSLNDISVILEDFEGRYGDLSIIDYLDTPFMSLSSGQKKKIALFRGLIKNPEIIFFDEFTDSLDINNQIELKNLIKKELTMNLKKTIIWVTHSIEEVKDICNKIIVLERGLIIHFDDCFDGSDKKIYRIKSLLTK